MQSEITFLRAPADSLSVRPSHESPGTITSRAFLAHANARVDAAKEACHGYDDVLEYLRARHPAPTPKPASQPVPAGFKREPHIFLDNVRFPRVRLFLSKFIGRGAWRQGVSL